MVQKFCSNARGRECAALALVLSVFVVVAWASVSSQRALAGARHATVADAKVVIERMAAATGLPGWISQQSTWVRNLSVPGSDGDLSDGSFRDMDDQSDSADRAVTGEPADARVYHSIQTTSVVNAAADAQGLQASVPADAPAQQPASAIAEPPSPAPRADADALAQPPAAAVVSAPRPGPFVQTLAAVSAPAPAPAVSSSPLATDPSLIDPRWLDGAAADLPACLRNDGDDAPATLEDIVAGQLPRRVQGCTCGDSYRDVSPKGELCS